jgi:hypothetical protein
MTNRDAAYLVSRDLCDFIRSEVVRSPRMAQVILVSVILVLGISLIWTLARAAPTLRPLPDVASVLSSVDPNVKLNYLLQREISAGAGWPWYIDLPITLVGMVALFLCAATALSPIGAPLKYVYPMNIFAIGRDGIRHRKLLEWRTRFFWTVIIGSLVRVAWSAFPALFSQR